MIGKPDLHIVVAGGIIMTVGTLNAIAQSKPIGTVVEGSVVLVLLLSILTDLAPDSLGKLAYALASLAVLVVLLVELPDLLKKVVPGG